MHVYVSCIGNFKIKHYVPALQSCSLSVNNSEKSSINFKFTINFWYICVSLNFINSSRYIFIVEVTWYLLISAMNFVDN